MSGKYKKLWQLASLGESVVCLDENNNILANSMLTGDCRGITEIQELIQHFGAQHIFEITGFRQMNYMVFRNICG